MQNLRIRRLGFESALQSVTANINSALCCAIDRLEAAHLRLGERQIKEPFIPVYMLDSLRLLPKFWIAHGQQLKFMLGLHPLRLGLRHCSQCGDGWAVGDCISIE